MIQNISNTDKVSVKVKNGTFKCYITNNLPGGESFYKETAVVLAIIKILIGFFNSGFKTTSMVYTYDAQGEKCTCFLWCRQVESGFIQVNIYDYFIYTNQNPTLPMFTSVQECEAHSLGNFERVGAHYAHHYHLDSGDFILVIDADCGAPVFQTFRNPVILDVSDENCNQQAGCLSGYHVTGDGYDVDLAFEIDISKYLTVAKTT